MSTNSVEARHIHRKGQQREELPLPSIIRYSLIPSLCCHKKKRLEGSSMVQHCIKQAILGRKRRFKTLWGQNTLEISINSCHQWWSVQKFQTQHRFLVRTDQTKSMSCFFFWGLNKNVHYPMSCNRSPSGSLLPYNLSHDKIYLPIDHRSSSILQSLFNQHSDFVQIKCLPTILSASICLLFCS